MTASSTSSAATTSLRTERLRSVLRMGMASASELCAALGISQATLSRTIQSVPEVRLFRLSGQRTPIYGLLRSLPGGVAAEQKLFRVQPDGRVQAAGEVWLLAGDASVLATPAASTRYDGLPPALRAAVPAGFLGRQVAQDAARTGLRVPAALRDWNDDHHAAYLFALSDDTPGDLVFGEAGLARALSARQRPPLRARDRAAAYVRMAQEAAGLHPGSSAGGEQPKFLAHTQEHGHVIVKYARSGSRWAQLLVLEHLALEALRQHGQAAAATQCLQLEDFVFLQVERFDRVGAHGRRGVASIGVIDDQHFGQRDHWNAFMDRCLSSRLLQPAAAQAARVQAAFGELIGNNDRHFENLGLLLDEQGRPQAVAPAYDCLPMRYAPLGGGVDPPLTPLQPRLAGHGADPAVWSLAWQAAQHFWGAVVQARHGLPLAPGWRKLAAANLQAGQSFVAPLLPGGAA